MVAVTLYFLSTVCTTHTYNYSIFKVDLCFSGNEIMKNYTLETFYRQGNMKGFMKRGGYG